MEARNGAQLACPVEPAGVPGCESGPGGRLAFVVRELIAAVRRQRTRSTRGTR